MTSLQTVWPAFPLTVPYLVSVPSLSHMARDYAGVVVPQMIPCVYCTVNEKPKESRKCFLYRSLFDLLDAHPYLALTDPKLLGWYLRLSPEDRRMIQDEGGFQQFLQRHPALEVSRYHVYVKYNTGSTCPVQSRVISNKHRSRMSEAKTCRCEMPHPPLGLELLPHNVRKTLSLLDCSSSSHGSQKHPHAEICHTKQLVHLEDGLQTAFSSHITQEPNHDKAHNWNKEMPSWQMDSSSSSAAMCNLAPSFPVDMELVGQGGKHELRTQGQSADFTYAEVGPLQSEWPLVESESASADTVDDDEASLTFEDQRTKFHSIMEDDKSILICQASDDVKANNSRVHSDPVSTNSEALAASSKTFRSDQSVIKVNAAEKYTSPVPCVTTLDITVGNELTPCRSAFTQTEDSGTSDKHVITEVHMTDLDYLAKEFIKLKMAKEELRERKEKMKRLGCKLRKECDCIQRAQRAELCLLALQFNMCRDHCWRLYSISAEGGQLTPMPKNPPANVLSVLQKLESDYNQMRDKILAGIPLEQLKPLSVDSEKITTGASYIPAQIIGDVLGNVPSWSFKNPQEHNTSAEKNGSPDNECRNGRQHSQMKELIKKNSKTKRAVTFVPQDRDAPHNANKREEKQSAAACKELNTGEAWYDAEEHLEVAGPAVAAEAGPEPTVITKDVTTESASEEAESSVLCVSNLPRDVTERDVMLWFERYHASAVSISALTNQLRVAIVMVGGPQSAEAAARELNGCSMQGHTLHVEHINRATGGCHSQPSASISESSQDATKPQTSKTDSSSTAGKLITESPHSSSIKDRKVVCISPTAKGTCVPQHYGTMGSFDTLMAELTQRHPDVGRQRIVDALIELKSRHQGAPSSLPLKTIREMTSELLTRPANAAQL